LAKKVGSMRFYQFVLILCIAGCSAEAEKPSRREAMLEYIRASADLGVATESLQAAEGVRDTLIAAKAAGSSAETNELTASREQVRGLLHDTTVRRKRADAAKAMLDSH
jgi:hypothetical protein